MFPNFGTQTGNTYPTASMVQQDTQLLGAQPTEQLRIPQMPTGVLSMGAGNQTQAQQPIQPGMHPGVANMVQALKGAG